MPLPPLATLDELAEFMGEVEFDPAQAALLLDVASATIRTFCRQTITAVEDDVVVLEAEGGYDLWLPERPATAVASVTIEGVAVPGSSFRLVSGGQVRFGSDLSRWGGSAPLGRRATVVYSHGYEEVPDDIKGVCFELAQRGIVTPSAGSVVQETIGSYSVSYSREAAATLRRGDEVRLLPYRPVITSVPILAG